MHKNSIVAVYESHASAAEGVKELGQAGFDVKKLSILGRDYRTEEASFAIPGIGPVLIAGPLADSILVALEGAAAVGGVSVLGAGLNDIGIPVESIVRCESVLRTDRFLLIAHGTPEEVLKARDILHRTHPDEISVHFEEERVPTPV
jgi:hypothetical protein